MPAIRKMQSVQFVPRIPPEKGKNLVKGVIKGKAPCTYQECYKAFKKVNYNRLRFPDFLYFIDELIRDGSLTGKSPLRITLRQFYEVGYVRR